MYACRAQAAKVISVDISKPANDVCDNNYDLNKDGYGDIPFRPVNLYATIVEKYDFSILFLKSFIVHLLNQAEKIIPSVTPTDLVDHRPIIKPYPL